MFRASKGDRSGGRAVMNSVSLFPTVLLKLYNPNNFIAVSCAIHLLGNLDDWISRRERSSSQGLSDFPEPTHCPCRMASLIHKSSSKTLQ